MIKMGTARSSAHDQPVHASLDMLWLLQQIWPMLPGIEGRCFHQWYRSDHSTLALAVSHIKAETTTRLPHLDATSSYHFDGALGLGYMDLQTQISLDSVSPCWTWADNMLAGIVCRGPISLPRIPEKLRASAEAIGPP